MRSPVTTRRSTAPLTVAMTPMIDVVFLLLVFFLVTASFQQPEADLAATLLVETQTPGVGVANDAAPELDEVLVVGRAVAGATLWSVSGGDEVASPGLPSLLQAFAEVDLDLPVTVDAGPDVPLGEVVTAYDAARAVGFVDVRLAASANAIDGGRP